MCRNELFYGLNFYCHIEIFHRTIHYLTRKFRVQLHLKKDIGFQVKFNAEFPRQVMNFP